MYRIPAFALIIILILFTTHTYAAPVYIAKDSRVYHHNRNCSKLNITDDLIEFSSPQQAKSSGGILCEYCDPSAVSEENISRGNIGMGASTEQRTESALSYRVADIPTPKRHVADRAEIIDKQTEINLNGLLSGLETKTGVQMVVLTIKSTGGIPIDQFSIDLANKWRLGQFEQNNGVLVVVVRDDRKYSIEIGAGLERILPNDFCAEVGETIFVPNFRTGNYSQGINQGSNAIINRIAQDAGVSIKGTQVDHIDNNAETQQSVYNSSVVYSMMSCKDVKPNHRHREVKGEVPHEINLANDTTAKQILEEAILFAQKKCPTKYPRSGIRRNIRVRPS